MTPLWNAFDNMNATYLYAVIGIFLVGFAIWEYRIRP
jgi:hypothetical protein